MATASRSHVHLVEKPDFPVKVLQDLLQSQPVGILLFCPLRPHLALLAEFKSGYSFRGCLEIERRRPRHHE